MKPAKDREPEDVHAALNSSCKAGDCSAAEYWLWGRKQSKASFGQQARKLLSKYNANMSLLVDKTFQGNALHYFCET